MSRASEAMKQMNSDAASRISKAASLLTFVFGARCFRMIRATCCNGSKRDESSDPFAMQAGNGSTSAVASSSDGMEMMSAKVSSVVRGGVGRPLRGFFETPLLMCLAFAMDD